MRSELKVMTKLTKWPLEYGGAGKNVRLVRTIGADTDTPVHVGLHRDGSIAIGFYGEFVLTTREESRELIDVLTEAHARSVARES